MNFFDRLGIVAKFSDEVLALVGMASEFHAATTVEAKAAIVTRAGKLISAQTATDIDDLAVEFVQAVFNSPEVVSAAKRLYEAIVAASKS